MHVDRDLIARQQKGIVIPAPHEKVPVDRPVSVKTGTTVAVLDERVNKKERNKQGGGGCCEPGGTCGSLAWCCGNSAKDVPPEMSPEAEGEGEGEDPEGSNEVGSAPRDATTVNIVDTV